MRNANVSPAPFTIVAHRGVLDRAPGTSLAAFRDALRLGVDGVELDVRLSRDGVPIVHELCPGVRTALLFGATQAYMHLDVVGYLATQSARLAHADAVHLTPDQLSDDVVATIRAAEIEVHVYPVNDQQTLDLVRRYRVPEVITDAPARVLDLRRSHGTGEERLSE